MTLPEWVEAQTLRWLEEGEGLVLVLQYPLAGGDTFEDEVERRKFVRADGSWYHYAESRKTGYVVAAGRSHPAE